MNTITRSTVTILVGLGFTINCAAQDQDTSSLAQDLSNPIASLISVPFQLNYDQNYGPQENGDVVKLVIQPVVPISLNDNWNLISRTIVPLIDQNDVSTAGGQSGLGDITAAMFRLEGANLELRSGDGSLAVIFNRRR